eukprot:TRINITY_DN18886_c0_g1_i1.p1 TRINITY_DN18886_c0_g1~~TRINITY_DN18886_c0_g1_i1.p1  ORF type:complete len:192 (-),score=38.57 TRINITY_DN18886_c0_g1_i1:36-611(-)
MNGPGEEPRCRRTQLTRIFAGHDIAGSGLMDRSDLASVMHEVVGTELTNVEVEGLLSWLCPDSRAGKVSYAAFVDAVFAGMVPEVAEAGEKNDPPCGTGQGCTEVVIVLATAGRDWQLAVQVEPLRRRVQELLASQAAPAVIMEVGGTNRLRPPVAVLRLDSGQSLLHATEICRGSSVESAIAALPKLLER